MIQKLAYLFLLCSVTFISAKNGYEGYKIYDVSTKNELQKGLLLLLSANEDLDFLTLPKLINRSARVLVKPEKQIDFEKELTKGGLDYTVINEDFGKTVEQERIQNNDVRSVRTGRVLFSKFLRIPEIYAYLNKLAESYPSRVHVKIVGKSFEGRDMKTITITNGDGRSNKKVIFIDAGIHAREWVAPATALYVINQLVENYSENAHLLKDYDWIVLPVINPDGYEYSHTQERMWRKTRKPVTSHCIGTDGNRNFDFQWGGEGASSIPCGETFKGTTPFSETETQVVRDIMHAVSGRAKMYLTLHSYGGFILYPWGYTTELPETWRDLDEVAQAGADAIRAATGGNYDIGSSTNLLGAAAGGSDDYALAVTKIPISFTMELPPGGLEGFDPTPAQIEPFASEAWVGIKAMAEKVIEKY